MSMGVILPFDFYEKHFPKISVDFQRYYIVLFNYDIKSFFDFVFLEMAYIDVITTNVSIQ